MSRGPKGAESFAVLPRRREPSSAKTLGSRLRGNTQSKGKNMRVYYDRDAALNLITNKKIAIVGYGSPGHAHAQNLRDSDIKDVAVALREGQATRKKAEEAGFKMMINDEAPQK